VGEFFHKTLRGAVPKISSGAYVKEVGKTNRSSREIGVKILGNR
jgi:hypothetical protein